MPLIFLCTLVGVVAGPLAHHVAVQTGAGAPWSPATALCRRCGQTRGTLVRSCRKCGAGDGRVWLTTAALGTLSGGLAWRIGAHWVLVAYLVGAFLSTVLFLTDVDHKRIPNRVTYSGVPASLLLLAAGALADGTGASLPRAVGGAVAFGAFFFLVYLAARGGFGFGDVKLAVLLGLFVGFTGWDRLLVAGFTTALVGGVMAVGAVVGGGAGAKTEIPYGPAMILGAWITVLGDAGLADLLL